jgi:hypothetical protein
MENRWEPYLQHLRNLPFVKSVMISRRTPIPIHEPNEYEADALLKIKTPQGNIEFYVEEKKSHLTYALADGLAVRITKAGKKPWILFALHVPRKIGRYLGEHGINYVDRAGNCRVQIGTDHVAIIEGQTPVIAAASGRGIGAPGYRVLFTILAKPEILGLSVRTLAELASVSKTTVAETLGRLEKEGFIGPEHNGRRILNPKGLLDRWMVGYEISRPKLIFGKFRTADPTPEALEQRIERELGDSIQWAWGGGAAAMRLMKHFHGEKTVLHIIDPTNDLLKKLRALRADDGPFIIYRTPSKVAFEGAAPRTVHPLLVYAELMATGDSRARETAMAIREHYLKL